MAIAQTITVVLIYKINPVQITTITAENTKNSLNSVPHTIEKYPIQNCEKFSPIVKVNLALFSSITAIIVPLLLIALMLSVKGSNQLLIKYIVKGSAPKCYKHTSFFHHALLCSLVLQTQLGASQNIITI